MRPRYSYQPGRVHHNSPWRRVFQLGILGFYDVFPVKKKGKSPQVRCSTIFTILRLTIWKKLAKKWETFCLVLCVCSRCFTSPTLFVCVHEVGFNVTVFLSTVMVSDRILHMLPTIGIASRQPGWYTLKARKLVMPVMPHACHVMSIKFECRLRGSSIKREITFWHVLETS